MQFDVIIGNPPYQMDGGGWWHERLVRSTSCSWSRRMQAGAAVSSAWSFRRDGWLAARGWTSSASRCSPTSACARSSTIPKLGEVFPGVEIKGGVCYFLWDRDHNGPCEVTTHLRTTSSLEPIARHLDEFDVFVRDERALTSCDKVLRPRASRRSNLSRVTRRSA